MAGSNAAYRDGAEFGAALYELAGKPDRASVNQGALFAAGKRFAGLFGYRDLSVGLDWVEGFTAGYMGTTTTAQLPAASSDPGD